MSRTAFAAALSRARHRLGLSQAAASRWLAERLDEPMRRHGLQPLAASTIRRSLEQWEQAHRTPPALVQALVLEAMTPGPRLDGPGEG